MDRACTQDHCDEEISQCKAAGSQCMHRLDCLDRAGYSDGFNGRESCYKGVERSDLHEHEAKIMTCADNNGCIAPGLGSSFVQATAQVTSRGSVLPDWRHDGKTDA